MIATVKKLIPQSVKNTIKQALGRSGPGVRTVDAKWTRPSTITAEQRAFWEANGFLIVSGLFAPERVEKVNALVDRLWAERRQDEHLVIDVFIGTPREKRMMFRDAPDEARAVPYKLNDLFLEHAPVRDMVTDPRLTDIMADLLEGDPLVCNGLTFERSSQQRYHFDTFYMPAPVENKMVASWIALEDVSPDAGPLGYYPGSHKIPAFKFSHGRLNAIKNEMPAFDAYIEPRLQELGLQAETFCPRRGDVLVWHSQLYHCGMPINDISLTRRSLVTHYFRATDFPADQVATIAPGRHFLKRAHQEVPH